MDLYTSHRSAGRDGECGPPSVRLTVGVSLSAVVAPVATVPTLVRRQLGVTVRTDQPQVFPSIVRRVAVDVVQHECEGQAQPRVRSAADRAAARLSVGEILTDVVTLVAIDPRRAGFEPTLGTDLAPDQCLAGVTAVDLLAALREC